MRVARQRQVSADGVVVVAVVDGADNRVVIRELGKAGQVLGDPHPRHSRGDRPEFAANLLGCVRLQIEDIQV